MLHWILPRLTTYIAVIITAGLCFGRGVSVYA